MSDISFKTKTIPAGEDLFLEGEIGHEAYLITKGLVSIWKTDQGQRVNLATRGEGDIVGEMGLIDEVERSASVTTEEDVEVEIITKKELHALLEETPEVMGLILQQLFESLRTANDLVAMYASRPTE